MSGERWVDRVRLLDDAPFDPDSATSDFDLLEVDGLVRLAARSMFGSRGHPMVIHVRGAWGQGKTSYCRMLEQELRKPTMHGPAATTGWYVASDGDGDPAKAILFALLKAVCRDDMEATLAGLRRWGPAGGGLGADPTRLESLRQWIARELGWDGAESGPSEQVTFLFPKSSAENEYSHPLQEEDGELRRGRVTAEQKSFQLQTPRQRMAVLFIDDLDRCSPDRVKAVFDVVRTLCSCRGVMFVIAADRGVLEAAFEHTLQELGASSSRRPSDAMEKYIRHHVDLPAMEIRSTHLSTRLQSLQRRLFADGASPVILRGPKPWMQDGVAYLWTTALGSALTLRGLKRLLNQFAVDMARVADRLELREEHFGVDVEDLVWTEERRKRAAPTFEPASRTTDDLESRRDAFANHFLGTLARLTTRTLWPEVSWQLDDDSELFSARIRALGAIGVRALDFTDSLFIAAVDALVPRCGLLVTTSDSVRRAVCSFLARATHVGPEASVLQPPISEVPQDFVSAESIEIPIVISATGTVVDVSAVDTALRDLVDLENSLGGEKLDLQTAIDRLFRVWRALGPHAELRRVLRVVAMRVEGASGIQWVEDDMPTLFRLWRHLGLAGEAAQAASKLTFSHPAPETRTKLLREYFRICADDAVDLSEVSPPVDHLLSSALRRMVVDDHLIRNETEEGHRLLLAAARLARKVGRTSVSCSEVMRVVSELMARYPGPDALQCALLLAATVSELGFDPDNVMLRLNSAINVRELADVAPFKLTHIVAEWFCLSDSIDDKSRAHKLYQRLLAEKCLTAPGLHNLAALDVSLTESASHAGRLWEIAYRAGYRVPALTRAFGRHLGMLGHTYEQLLVLEGKDLPSEFHPFTSSIPDSILCREPPSDDE